jgi:hypothetical protein
MGGPACIEDVDDSVDPLRCRLMPAVVRNRPEVIPHDERRVDTGAWGRWLDL